MRSAYIAALLVTLVTSAWPQAPSPTPKDETRAWRTYRSRKYGFQFRYPQGLSAVETGPDIYERRLLAGKQISGTQPPLLESIQVKDRRGGVVLTIDVPDQKRFPVVREEYDWSLRACGQEGFAEIQSTTRTSLAGYKTLRVDVSEGRFYCVNFPRYPIIVHFDSAMERTATQILSTLSLPR